MWVLVLLGPIAWSIAFGVWATSLTGHACGEPTARKIYLITAAVAALLTAIGGVFAGTILRRRIQDAEPAPFMLKLAVGGSALFLAVILLSVAPILLLGACRQ